MWVLMDVLSVVVGEMVLAPPPTVEMITTPAPSVVVNTSPAVREMDMLLELGPDELVDVVKAPDKVVELEEEGPLDDSMAEVEVVRELEVAGVVVALVA